MAIHIWRHERLSGGPASLEAMFGQMAETFKCPHCGAMYEIHEKSVSYDEKDATDCQVCGKQMESTKGSTRIRDYELVKMPDGTSI